MLYIQKMPLMYHAYVFFPVYFWNQIIRNYRSLFEALNLGLRGGIARFFIILAGSLLFLEALVCIHGIA
jgi:phosphatidylinositol glycan class N